MALVALRVLGPAGVVQAGGLVQWLELGCRLGLDRRLHPPLPRNKCRRSRNWSRNHPRYFQMPVE